MPHASDWSEFSTPAPSALPALPELSTLSDWTELSEVTAHLQTWLDREIPEEPFPAELMAEIQPISLALADRASVFWPILEDSQADDRLHTRLQLLRRLYPEFRSLCQHLHLPKSLLAPLWSLWIPLAQHIAHWRSQQAQPLIVGFLGGQGTGKTTLTQILRLILRSLHYETVSLSLDDLYLPYAQRQQLQAQDPRLDRRGPPGTHDVSLGLSVLKQLRSSRFPVDLPRFDKSAQGGAGDRTLPDRVAQADIVLFEGWFVGARPIAPFLFEDAPEPIVTEADREFAIDMNTQLYEYLPLWDLIDRLIILHVPDYRLSLQWRWEAEAKMRAQGKPGMTDREMTAFVEYFWKALHPELFITPLIEEPQWVDLVFEIAADHLPRRAYRPA